MFARTFFILPKLIYVTEYYILPAIPLFMNTYPHATTHHSPMMFLQAKFSAHQHWEPAENTLTKLALLFLVSIILTVNNPFSAGFIDIHLDRINAGLFGSALTTRCAGFYQALMQWSSITSVVLFASQSPSPSFARSQSPSHWSQLLVLEMLSGALSSSPSTG